MKKVLIIFAVVGLFAASGCKKDRPELDVPGSKLEGINANWEMVDVVMVDIASLAQKRLNVTEAFIGAMPMKMNFNAQAFTYAVTKGSGPNYFGVGGKWAFDDNEFPTQITLTPDAGEAKILKLVRTIRPIDPFLNFSYARTCANDDGPYIAYEFKFARTAN